MSEESDIETSPLCQDIERDGKTVRVDIYKGTEEGWLLKVVDEFNNSTTWDDPFCSDQAALDEALDAIEKEGIACLIGPETGFQY